MVSNRKPQLTKPVKLLKPELQENNESLGRWHLCKCEKRQKDKKKKIENRYKQM